MHRMKKKFYHQILMKKTSFDALKRLVPCIDLRLDELKKKIPLVKSSIDTLVNFLKNKMIDRHCAQTTQVNAYEVMSIIDELSVDDFEIMYKNVKSPEFGETDAKYLLHELKSLHAGYIIDCLKFNIEQ